MITYFVTFVLALMVSLVMTFVVRNRAHAYGWLEQAAKSSRKIHRSATPRLGGVAIVIGFLTPLTAVLFVRSGVDVKFTQNRDVVIGLLGGGLVIALLGLYDDFRGAGAAKKFGVQVAVAIALWFLGFRVETLTAPILGDALEMGFLSLPVTVIWIVGVINALNLIDGLDGLAGGVAFFAVATNFLLAFANGNILMCLIMASLGGAVLGFLVFNFNPASIFMGDTGSMFLGFVLAATSIKTSQKGGTAVALLVPVLALGLPIMDTMLAMSRRALRGRPMFSADKEHIHHRLMSRLRLSHRHAVLVLYGVSSLFALTSLALAYANSAQTALLLAGVAIVVFVLMRKLGYMNMRGAGELPKIRQRNLELRTSVRTAAGRVRTADDLPSLWEALRPVSEAMEASRFSLRLEQMGIGMSDRVTFEVLRQAGTALPLEVSIDTSSNSVVFGQLQIAWCDGRIEVNRDEEIALELLADVVGEKAARLAGFKRVSSSVEKPGLASRLDN